jgi:hypothetical protein
MDGTLVVSARYRIGEAATLAKLRDTTLRICVKKAFAASTSAVLPHHLHLDVRGAVAHSPEEIALAFLNNLAHVQDQQRWWEAEYYAGTFGEYGMAAVRPKGAEVSSSPDGGETPAGWSGRGRNGLTDR